MSDDKLSVNKIVQLQNRLLQIIEDVSSGKLSPEEAETKSKPLYEELNGSLNSKTGQ